MLSCIPPFFHHALAFQRSLIKAPSILIPEMLPKIFHQNKKLAQQVPADTVPIQFEPSEEMKGESA